MTDEHPAKWVVSCYAEQGLYEPLKEWLLQKLPGFCLPGEAAMPALGQQVLKLTSLCKPRWLVGVSAH